MRLNTTFGRPYSFGWSRAAGPNIQTWPTFHSRQSHQHQLDPGGRLRRLRRLLQSRRSGPGGPGGRLRRLYPLGRLGRLCRLGPLGPLARLALPLLKLHRLGPGGPRDRLGRLGPRGPGRRLRQRRRLRRLLQLRRLDQSGPRLPVSRPRRPGPEPQRLQMSDQLAGSRLEAQTAEGARQNQGDQLATSTNETGGRVPISWQGARQIGQNDNREAETCLNPLQVPGARLEDQ